MKNLFYYQVEPYKGYIPSDKINKNGQAFETGFWDKIIGEKITEKWQEIRHEIPLDKYKLQALFSEVNQKIQTFNKDKPMQDETKCRFYLNFNCDGIDCYVSRWNWKEL